MQSVQPQFAGGSASAARAGSLDQHMRSATQVLACIEQGYFDEAKQECRALFGEGRHHIARVILEATYPNPLPVALKLAEALSHHSIQFDRDLTAQVARAARLYLELTAFKCSQDGFELRPEMLQDLKAQLKVVKDDLSRDNNRERVNDQLQLSFDITCSLEAIRSMESVDYQGLFKDLYSVITEQSLSKGLGRIKILQEQRGTSWFADMLYISWMGTLCTEDVAAFDDVAEGVKRLAADKPQTGLGGVALYTDLVERGTPAIQTKALEGLVELAHLHGGRLGRSYWKVRYRAVQYLHTCTLHEDRAIKDRATDALLLLNAREGNRDVRSLFDKIEENPEIIERWHPQFAQDSSEIWEAKQHDEQELQGREEELQAREQKLLQQADDHSETVRQECLTVQKEREALDQAKADFDDRVSHLDKLENLLQKHLDAFVGRMLPAPSAPSASAASVSVSVSVSEMPEQFFCPLGFKPMVDPVTATEAGDSYERSEIIAHIRNGGTDPVTSRVITLSDLRPNKALRDMIEGWYYGQPSPSDDNGSSIPQNPGATIGPSLSAQQSVWDELSAGEKSQGNSPVETAVKDSQDRAVKARQACEDSQDRAVKARQAHEDSQDKFVKSSQACEDSQDKFVKSSQACEDSHDKFVKSSQKLADAQFRLGLLRNGEGVKKSHTEAADLFRKAAEQGHADAQFMLGVCYMTGEGVDQSDTEANKWFRDAAEQGHARAEFNLGFRYSLGDSVEQSDAKAAEWFEKAAEHENAAAQFWLGIHYRDGKGVDQSHTEAAKWFRRAAVQEHADADAQFMLGICYKNGEGVEPNRTEAKKWFRDAAEQGHVRAGFNLIGQDFDLPLRSSGAKAADGAHRLGVCYKIRAIGIGREGAEQCHTEAVKWFRRAAEQGHAGAQYSLGECFRDGEGVEQSHTEAVEWFRKAAEQDDAVAQFTLGVRYYHGGRGVEQNHTEAAKWFRKAAEQRDATAQYYLGICFRDGEGVDQSDTEAAEWFRKAALLEHADGQYNLGLCFSEGEGVEQSHTEAVELFRKAAEQDHAVAQFNLGVRYYLGEEGVEQNHTEAAKWFRRAAEQEHAEAQFNLGICYRNGEGVEQSDTEAAEWLRKAALQEHANAQFLLGDCYRVSRGVEQSDTEAAEWFLKAALQKHATAQYFLGECYRFGSGVEQSDTEAAKWFRKAAEQEDADAQFFLGTCFRDGKGVDQSDTRAEKWFRKAAGQGNARAIAALE